LVYNAEVEKSDNEKGEVEVVVEGKKKMFRGKNIVICCGAITD
jgi:hypothetical protein